MAEQRKGFLTSDQEKKLDDLVELKGLPEAFDGVAIRIADNTVLEKLKGKLDDQTLQVVYQIIDEIFAALPDKK